MRSLFNRSLNPFRGDLPLWMRHPHRASAAPHAPSNGYNPARIEPAARLQKPPFQPAGLVLNRLRREIRATG